MADQYYYADGQERRGPVDMATLRSVGITRETLVWREGMPDWRPAGDVPELASFFTLPGRKAGPPPIEERPPRERESSPLHDEPSGARLPQRRSREDELARTSPPKTYLVESIVATILCCLPFGVVGIVNASRVESRFYAGDLDGAERASREAAKWTKISVGVGLASIVFFFLISLLGAF